MITDMNLKGRSAWNVADTAGTPRTRALASALRRARTEANFGVREVSRRLGLSHTTISQWETGKRVPHPEDVSAMLAAIGLTGAPRDEILELARGAADPNWLVIGSREVSPGLAGVRECERTAVEIIEWSPLVVPGLLQTEDYARAIIGAEDSLLPKDIEAHVHIRRERRIVLTKERDARPPAEFTALIGEWALRQRVGGGKVLAEQLRELVALSASGLAAVQVIQIGDDWHPGLAGPFILYNFPDLPSIVHLEHHRSSVFLYDEDSVTSYKAATNQIRRAAMEQADSARLIAKIASEMEDH
ncbi:helix-turn-helix domain-containing protein [Actinokineospora sp.]|uniref:helix-turn-helix domain-containing protein n=1 Tax=Actinokineospora sp. TaxID=1872133 RepID=UPI0040379EA4